MAKTLTATLAALLLAPTFAGATPLRRALVRGEEYWGIAPCSGHVYIERTRHVPRGRLPSNVPAGDVLQGWADWDTPEGRNYESPVFPLYTDCHIYINANLWPSMHVERRYFQELCDVVTHELGHLLGHGDEGQANPRSIQYPIIGAGSANFDAVPECR